MDSPNLFSVTVSRINESTDKEPYHTMDAYRVTARQDGSLSIEGDGGHKISIFSNRMGERLTARFESYGAGSRLRLGWARRWSMRRIAARVTIASETSGSVS